MNGFVFLNCHNNNKKLWSEEYYTIGYLGEITVYRSPTDMFV